MDINYIVRTHREGTIDSTPEIETRLTSMGCDILRTRTLGSVVAIVEKEAGIITKQKLRWGEDNDPKFQGIVQADADLLLADAVRASTGGGEDNDIRLKIVGKR
ncbi:MAG: hypothetical protein ACI857_000089 [Arenicella sp.]|jgi:hypothetical protein